jgi:hypothetical protein
VGHRLGRDRDRNYNVHLPAKNLTAKEIEAILAAGGPRNRRERRAFGKIEVNPNKAALAGLGGGGDVQQYP